MNKQNFEFNINSLEKLYKKKPTTNSSKTNMPSLFILISKLLRQEAGLRWRAVFKGWTSACVGQWQTWVLRNAKGPSKNLEVSPHSFTRMFLWKTMFCGGYPRSCGLEPELVYHFDPKDGLNLHVCCSKTKYDDHDVCESCYITAFIFGRFHVYLYAILRKLHSREIGASLNSVLGAQDVVAVLWDVLIALLAFICVKQC